MFKMKIGVLASLSAAIIFGANPIIAAPSAVDLKHCKAMSEMARVVMQLRQYGVRMSELMEEAESVGGYWGDLMGIYIEDAFRRPIYTGETAQSAAVDEFEDIAYAACLRTRKKK
ncbi:hypothetical protein [Achromobacter pestifer]|uniref:hypothetical protein n=1 Tax=Achromobacter pestifer TaxID=1353889 RepID=UPI001582A6C6|nr:hypothetical protein [Achromobacter pestifer]